MNYQKIYEYTSPEVINDIEYYKSLPVKFNGFIDIPELTDGIMHLIILSKDDAIPEKKYVPAYNFGMYVENIKVGEINLRIGYIGFGPDSSSLYYGGQIGYNVDEQYRGNGYAPRACKIVGVVAKAHEMTKLLITNNITNNASRRVCEKLEAKFVRAVKLPEWTDMYKEGHRAQNIFELSI